MPQYVCVLLAPRKAAAKPAPVTAEKSDSSSVGETASAADDGDDDVVEMEDSPAGSAGNKESKRNIALSSPNK